MKILILTVALFATTAIAQEKAPLTGGPEIRKKQQAVYKDPSVEFGDNGDINICPYVGAYSLLASNGALFKLNTMTGQVFELTDSGWVEIK